MGEGKKPLVIILGGTYGVGKTTLAHQLGIDLQIMTRVCLSGITNTITTILSSDPAVKNWNKYNSLNIRYIRSKLRKEAKIVGQVIHTIVNGAEYAGENYVFDGMQFLPEFLPMDKVLFFYIYVSNDKKHKKQFSQPVITRSLHKNNPSYVLAKKIGQVILDESAGYKIFKVNNIGTPKETSKQIIKKIKKAYPDYEKKYLWFEKEK